VRFMQGYREAVDWMYAGDEAANMYAKKINADPALIKDSIAQFQPKAALQTDKMADLDGAMRDAVKLKFLDRPLTSEQIAEFIRIPPRQQGGH
jgi:NitT/TauT family transport system substrate-binding protein